MVEEQGFLGDNSECVSKMLKLKSEEDEEDFRSCCEDEDELIKREICAEEEDSSNCKLDEKSIIKMYFKGVSVSGPGDYDSRVSGIGVIIENSDYESPIRIQKKLDFYVENLVAEYLALLDGLSVAIQNDIKSISAFTDSEMLYNQIMHGEALENPLLSALRQRIVEQVSNFDSFVLKHVPPIELISSLQLAQVAVGIVSFPSEGDESIEKCSLCCEEKLSSMILKLKCSHKFCSHCMKTYVEEKLRSSEIPIKCPESKCKYRISADECRLFLPFTSHESLERVLTEANALKSDKIYCPYPDCLVFINPHECLSSLSDDNNTCVVECRVCQRFICVDCGVPWHSSMTCEEYQNLTLDERDASGLALHSLERNKRSRRCRECRTMVEVDRGGYHMRCWCGHEFCYSCGTEYRDGEQTCECVSFLHEDDYYSENSLTRYPAQQFEQWTWDSFVSLPMMMDAYSDQERYQLALIQRFLAGGFGLSDHHQQPYEHHHESSQRCTDSYADAMKDLHQLPWLERFVSVISDDYYEDYIQ